MQEKSYIERTKELYKKCKNERRLFRSNISPAYFCSEFSPVTSKLILLLMLFLFKFFKCVCVTVKRIVQHASMLSWTVKRFSFSRNCQRLYAPVIPLVRFVFIMRLLLAIKSNGNREQRIVSRQNRRKADLGFLSRLPNFNCTFSDLLSYLGTNYQFPNFFLIIIVV